MCLYEHPPLVRRSALSQGPTLCVLGEPERPTTSRGHIPRWNRFSTADGTAIEKKPKQGNPGEGSVTDDRGEAER